MCFRALVHVNGTDCCVLSKGMCIAGLEENWKGPGLMEEVTKVEATFHFPTEPCNPIARESTLRE